MRPWLTSSDLRIILAISWDQTRWSQAHFQPLLFYDPWNTSRVWINFCLLQESFETGADPDTQPAHSQAQHGSWLPSLCHALQGVKAYPKCFNQLLAKIYINPAATAETMVKKQTSPPGMFCQRKREDAREIHEGFSLVLLQESGDRLPLPS